MSEQLESRGDIGWSHLTRVQKLVTGLVAFTAVSHILFSYGWDSGILGINLGVWFVLNGVGYLILVYLLYFAKQFPDQKDTIRYALAAWTLGSIIAWALFHTASDRYDTLLDASLINKSIEGLILFLLVTDMRSLEKSDAKRE